MKAARRIFLKGAFGTAIALPWLEALSPKQARAGTPAPNRFIGLYHPNGVFTPKWFPTRGASETEFALGPIHAALEPWKQQLLFTSGIDMSVAIKGTGEMHQRGVGGWLTGAKLASGTFVGNDGTMAGYATGPSLDQVLVRLIGLGTAIPSLQLGAHALMPNVSGVVSYAAANQPLLPQNDPRLTFKTIFGTDPTGLGKLASSRQSILDAVQGQVKLMQKRTSALDKQRLDRHLTLLRELETRVTNITAPVCAKVESPAPVDFASETQVDVVAKLQVDLLLAAMRCDLTRVATIMLADAQNHLALPHLGIATDIHNLTHLSDGTPDREKVATRDTWVASIMARLLEGLDGIIDSDGSTATSNSLLLWGTDVSRGNTHSHDNMPFVLAGGGAKFRMGRYATWQAAFHNDMLVSILNAFGSPVQTFGDPAFCRGPLSNLV
jgi:hypothetical protein